MKATEQKLGGVLFILLCKVILTCESLYSISLPSCILCYGTVVIVMDSFCYGFVLFGGWMPFREELMVVVFVTYEVA